MKILISVLFFLLVTSSQSNTDAKSKFKLADDGKKIYKSTLTKISSTMPKIKVYYPELEAQKVDTAAKLQTKEKEAKAKFVLSDNIRKATVVKEDINIEEDPAAFFENINKIDSKTIDME